MIKFYWNTAPNPAKVALCLEEMGLAYEIIPIDTRKGDQHKPEFLAINPNAKVPATTVRRSSTATPSCSISPRRPASSFRRRRRTAASSCRG